MEKYSFHQLRKLFKDEPLANIQKVSEEIGPNAAVKKDTGRWSLLHIASTTDRSDVTQHLITKGSDVNVLDKAMVSLLCITASLKRSPSC